jgi:chromosomal replication initiation ATPase DnaA
MTPTKDQILKAVCDYYETDPKYIFIKTREKVRVLKRQMLIFLLLTDAVGTLSEHTRFIELVSGETYDHATLIHSRNKIQAQRKFYSDIETAINKIRSGYKTNFNHFTFCNTTGCNINYN